MVNKNKRYTVKEIEEIDYDEFEDMLTEEQYYRIVGNKAGYMASQALFCFLDELKDSARLSGQGQDEEHTSIDEYLEYWEEIYDNDVDDEDNEDE